MFCSVVIPTVNRPTLARAVESILQQPDLDPDEVEVIVVNDSARPLPRQAWQSASNVRILATNRRGVSIARNAGATIAVGRYLGFLDDDDWYAPRALETFRRLAEEAPEAAWLYGGAEIVDEHGTALARRNLGVNGNGLAPILGGAWIPMQCSLIKSSVFFETGGFDPLLGPGEEVDLCARVLMHGELANTAATTVFILRGTGWETACDHSVDVEFNRKVRSKILGRAGAFSRIWASAGSPYWKGRVFRSYFTSALWSFRGSRYLTGANRLLGALVTLAGSFFSLTSTDFWQAAKADHPPCNPI